MNTLIANAIERGLITFQPPPQKKKRGYAPSPELHERYERAKTLWERQMTLDEVCDLCGISINTFRWKYYKKGDKK